MGVLELELNYLRKIRVLFKRNDDLVLQGSNIDRGKFLSNGGNSVINSTVIIELFIPRGGRNIYGLLGADYSQSTSNNIDVCVSSGNIIRPKLLRDSLAGKIDVVHICLPDDARASVFEEMKAMSEDDELNIAGKLDFCYGAYSEVSSSEWIFRKLTKLIITLLNISESEVSPNLINKLIDG